MLLRDYAYKLIKDDFGQEFKEALGDWRSHTKDLVLACRKAQKRHQAYLENLQKALEAERERSQWFAMFALSLLGGTALSAFSSLLQHRIGPKLFGDRAKETRVVTKQVPALPKPSKEVSKLPPSAQVIDPSNPARPAGQGPSMPKAAHKIGLPNSPTVRLDLPRTVFDPDFAKTKGKMLGDLGKNGAGELGVNAVFKVDLEADKALRSAVESVPNAIDLDDLERRLDRAWEAAQTLGESYILGYANMYYADDAWPDRFWAQINAINPSASDFAKYQFGKTLIWVKINAQRLRWSNDDEWFYYGHKPITMTEEQMANAFEVELWALWMSQENYQPEQGYRIKHPYTEERFDRFDRQIRSRSGIDINAILPRLKELGVVGFEAIVEFARRGGPANDQGLVPAELHNISGDIDKYFEFEEIKKWFKSRKPLVYGGQLRGLPRSVGPLRIRTQFQKDPPAARR